MQIKNISKLQHRNKILSDYKKNGHPTKIISKENITNIPKFSNTSSQSTFGSRRSSCPEFDTDSSIKDTIPVILNELNQTKQSLAFGSTTLSQIKQNIAKMKNSIKTFKSTNSTTQSPRLDDKKEGVIVKPRLSYREQLLKRNSCRVRELPELSENRDFAANDSHSMNYFIEKQTKLTQSEIQKIRNERSKEMMRSGRIFKPSYIKKGLYMQQLGEVANDLTQFNEEFVCFKIPEVISEICSKSSNVSQSMNISHRSSAGGFPGTRFYIKRRSLLK